jgi:hypothetical protein
MKRLLGRDDQGPAPRLGQAEFIKRVEFCFDGVAHIFQTLTQQGEVM